MSQETDKLLAKKMLKVVKEDPPERKYGIVFRDMTVTLNREEYINFLTARVIMKKATCAERRLKDADEVTDAEIYKLMITLACDTVVQSSLREKIKIIAHEQAKAQALDHMMSVTEEVIKDLEKDSDGGSK